MDYNSNFNGLILFIFAGMTMLRNFLRFTHRAQISKKTIDWKSRGQSFTRFACLFVVVLAGTTALKFL